MTANQWKSKGKLIDIFNRKIFVIDEGISDKTLVILHGYPTSSYDYYKVLPELAKHYRVIIHDHVGFGFSDKPFNYSYSLIEQADIALQLWQQLQLKNVTLLAHDYGTSVATEIVNRYNRNQLNINIEELILCNGSMHIELAKLRFIQKLLKSKTVGKWVGKLTNQFIFDRNIRKIYFDSSKISQQELDEIWAQINYNDGKKVIHLLSNYINERYFFWHRWIGALKNTQIPTKIVWTTHDPIAVKAIAEQLHKEIPNNELKWLENTGHFPMLENPDEWTKLVLS
ncbi:pimeloyl-ACP methyl ester carboxylesterase [Tenacibaculum adriaticum]|uniref:Pimeloyl-ACP methyl ester carboxylesterase n=1 Tax=Tenacibaculum adriaticum TaxID=413713 RepID=A0A5S5DWI1_9FLAO|nr:alpha/beta hydrolase [Tenacibaculum adriaticum]TYP99132.1 pimeloyl-ACP methyl ester carboxylesterase [Tenacibaculum adriaticum]